MATRGHIVVLGGAGYLGAHVLLSLRERRYLVTAVDDLSSGARENTRVADHFVRLDVRDRTALSALLTKRPTAAVVHLAAVADPLRARRDPEVAVEINAGGTAALLSAMRSAKLRRLVTAIGLPLYEGEPGSAIGLTDALAPELLRQARVAWGLEPAILKLGHLEGRASGVIDPRPGHRTLIRDAPGEKPGTADALVDLDLLHVADAADALATALDRLLAGDVPDGPLEVGLGRAINAAELDEALTEVSGGAGYRPAAVPSGRPAHAADPARFRAWAPDWAPQLTTAAAILRSGWPPVR